MKKSDSPMRPGMTVAKGRDGRGSTLAAPVVRDLVWQRPVFVEPNPFLRAKMAPITPYLLKIAAPDPHHRPVFVGFVGFCVPRKKINL
jgi:hypothetical protein